MSTRSLILGSALVRRLSAAGALACVLAACERDSLPLSADVPPSAAASPQELHRLLAEARAGTARFHDVEVAIAAGYVPISECVAMPELGGMGIHYGNFALFADADFSPGEPEILLYEPQANGRLKLVGVEYAVSAEAWHAAGNTAPPAFAGTPFEEGPAGYMLHAWVWTPNPNGVFASFNPRVGCPVPGPEHTH